MSNNKVWEKISPQIKEYFGNAVFDAWLRNIHVKTNDNLIIISVTTNLAKDYIETKFINQILSYARRVDSNIDSVSVEINNSIDLDIEDNKNKSSVEENLSQSETIIDSCFMQFNPKFSFENFIVGEPNKMAFEIAKNIAKQDEIIINPLYIYGNVGLGKTHLMHAIYWAAKKNKRVAYMSAETFMSNFISAIKNKNSDSFKNNLRSVDILMIDDIQFISDKDLTQNELAHTINTLLNANKQIILSANKIYSELSGFSDYLRSRFMGGLAVNIHPTTYELRLNIIKSKMKVDLSKEIIEFLAQKITSNVRELEGALQRVTSYATYINPNLDVHTVYTLLQDMIEGSPNVVLSVDTIVAKVGEYYKISLDEIYSTSRLKRIVRARQMAIYLSKKLLQLSMSAIARAFKNRDVTTILYAIKIIEKLKKDEQIRKDLECLTQILRKR